MTIRDYLVTLLTVSCVTAVASAIAAEGKLKKYVNLILSLVVMLTLLAPLGGVIGHITWEEWLPLPDAGNTTGGDGLLEATENAVGEALCRALGLGREEVEVEISGSVNENGEVTLREIAVHLTGEARRARERVWTYLKEQVGDTCDIRVSI